MVYCISYDLITPGKNYDALYEAIKSFGRWWHQTGSVWFIASDKSPSQIRDFLRTNIDENDKLFVVRVYESWAGTGFSQEEYNWLKNQAYE